MAEASMQSVDLHTVPTEPVKSELDVPTEAAGDEEAMLMTGGIKIEIVDWTKFAWPVERFLCVVQVALLGCAYLTTDWAFGVGEQHSMVHAGLRVWKPSGDVQAAHLNVACVASGSAASTVPCQLAAAGRITGSLCGFSLAVSLLLGACFVLDAFDACGSLARARALVPAAFPIDRIASLVPPALWTLSLLLVFFTLLVFALTAPPSLGGGLARLGSSYGLVRLTLLVALTGLAARASLVHGIGEDLVVGALDTVRGHWAHMSRRQKLTQGLLGCAFLCEILLWIRRVEWGGLILAYGLWAHANNHPDHLSVFCCARVRHCTIALVRVQQGSMHAHMRACTQPRQPPCVGRLAGGALFSLLTDALTLATDESNGVLPPLLTWALLLSKLGAVAIMVSSKQAFV